MRKLFLYMVYCLLLFSTLSVHAAGVEPLTGEAVITSDALNVRSGPSTEYAILGTLNKGDTVAVEGMAGTDWYVIDYHGEQGYIYKDYLIFTPAEVGTEEAQTGQTTAISLRSLVILGLGILILLVVGVMLYTLASMKRDEEEEIPVCDHDDTNMHLGEVTYDTYRLDIDPALFETTTLIEQPESVLEESGAKEGKPLFSDKDASPAPDPEENIDARLKQASVQLAALQKEVEELKKRNSSD